MNSHIDPKFKNLEKEYRWVVQCNRCGFCETICPTYMASGKETLSPRGRSQAFRQILEGKIKNPAIASEIFSTCLACHACTTVCFTQVPIAKLMGTARDIARHSKTNFFFYHLEGILFRNLLSYRKLLSIFIWTAFFFKRLGFSGLLKKTKILDLLSPELAHGEDLLENVPLIFGGNRGKESKTKPQIEIGKELPKTAYFSGCGVHYVYPEVSRSFVGLLKKYVPNLKYPNHACCGLFAQSFGDVKTAKFLARKNIRQFKAADADLILVDDDSCCGFMKNYGEFLDGDPEAQAFSKKVKNLSEFLAEYEIPIDKTFHQPTTQKITCHDPCQMGNAHQQTQSVRKILKILPQVQFMEMNESKWCCGGAGAYCLKHPLLSSDILERKISNIKKSGAEIVITQAASCLMHLRYGMRKKGLEQEIQVKHLAEFLHDNKDLKYNI